MKQQECHRADRDLLLAMDGELPPAEAARVRAHLEACWRCRARKRELEEAIAGFVREQGRRLTPLVPSADGPRALLKAHLAEMAARGPGMSPGAKFSWTRAGAAAAAVLIAGIALGWLATPDRQGPPAVAVPNPNLTPGATVLVSSGQVCREAPSNNKEVPVALQRRVFDEYGIRHPQPQAYEVDYLITPALGGADDIHNLWPQSSANTEWNAAVKDVLEDHLRALVCAGEIDLATAQMELAENWIDAYKKYFHTDSPLRSVRQ